MERVVRAIPSLIGVVVLLSALSVAAYWIFAFVYFGATGSFDGLVEMVVAKSPELARIPLRPGPFERLEWRSWAYHALRTLGPGVIFLVPSYVLMRLTEAALSWWPRK